MHGRVCGQEVPRACHVCEKKASTRVLESKTRSISVAKTKSEKINSGYYIFTRGSHSTSRDKNYMPHWRSLVKSASFKGGLYNILLHSRRGHAEGTSRVAPQPVWMYIPYMRRGESTLHAQNRSRKVFKETSLLHTRFTSAFTLILLQYVLSKNDNVDFHSSAPFLHKCSR